MWYLYILRCNDDSLYVGITIDIPARMDTHNSGKGAKYTRSRSPVTLVYFETCQDEGAARKREHEIKSWPRKKKLNLIAEFPSSRLEEIFEPL